MRIFKEGRLLEVSITATALEAGTVFYTVQCDYGECTCGKAKKRCFAARLLLALLFGYLLSTFSPHLPCIYVDSLALLITAPSLFLSRLLSMYRYAVQSLIPKLLFTLTLTLTHTIT